MTPETIWRQLQDRSLPAERFRHDAHVKAIWFLLQDHDLPEAARKFIKALKAYAAHLGAVGKYHETITLFYVYETASRRRPGESWVDFAQANPDLFDHGLMMRRNYQDANLQSDFARGHYLPPDRSPSSSVSSTR